MNSLPPGRFLAAIFRLGKWSISIPVALTGFLGYFLYLPVLDRNGLLATGGIFLLSMGSSALNQIQERKTDARMERTASRPIPSGTVSVARAAVIAGLLSVAGTVLLLATGNMLAALLGAGTLLWYNGVYTPLKRVTAFAVLPGALIGALPPLIGWSAAGGHPLDMEILAVGFLLFIGQMPHYWLLMLKVGHEFHEAGLPVITTLLRPGQIRNLSFVWITATAVVVLMLPATPVITSRWVAAALILLAVLFLIRMFRISYRGDLIARWKTAFITVNLFYLVIILALIADRLVTITLYTP